MNSINNILNAHGTKIIIFLLIIIYIKSCNVDNELTRIKKETKANSELLMNLPSAKDLKIEGLNVEKRMIQATDRKLIDVRRQTDIEKEIKILESK